MLQHAREAHDMHAGEVYGEKAILATEVKELQSHLLCLSDERDNSLAILDNMRRALEQRLDTAEKEMKAAEEEKMEKENCARKALAEQQLLIDKLVQESKKLKQEAEENSKVLANKHLLLVDLEIETTKRTSPTSSISDPLSSGEEVEANDDEWEFFAKNLFLILSHRSHIGCGLDDIPLNEEVHRDSCEEFSVS